MNQEGKFQIQGMCKLLIFFRKNEKFLFLVGLDKRYYDIACTNYLPAILRHCDKQIGASKLKGWRRTPTLVRNITRNGLFVLNKN